MKLRSVVSPDMGENCFIAICEETKKAVIIDPGSRANDIKKIINDDSLSVEYILMTHCHYDHIGALKEVAEFTKAPVVIAQGEEVIAESAVYNLSEYFAGAKTVKYDKVAKDGEHFKAGQMDIELILTPGHTPGGCCYYFKNEGVLFSGDTLFFLSIGRTDFPLGSTEEIEKSIRQKLYLLPDDTKVFPGHGQATTIGFEKKNGEFTSI